MSYRSSLFRILPLALLTLVLSEASAQDREVYPQIKSVAEFKKLSRKDRGDAWDLPEYFGLKSKTYYTLEHVEEADVRKVIERLDKTLPMNPRLEVSESELYNNEDQPRAFVGTPRPAYIEVYRVPHTGELVGFGLAYAQEGCEGEPGAFEESRFSNRAEAESKGCLDNDVQWQWSANYYSNGRLERQDVGMEWAGY